ncbi:HAMP domain-containing histidine kinase [Thermoleophilia bacterium SCSIO 60948]|nr:HAMP domain-containing histidine kinase [Thermoleophilia bacterium SCSIO 60948]
MRQSLGARFVAALLALAVIVAALAVALLGALSEQREALDSAARYERALLAVGEAEATAGRFVAVSTAGGDALDDATRDLVASGDAIERELLEAGGSRSIAAAGADDVRFLAEGAGEPAEQLRIRFGAAASALGLAADRLAAEAASERAEADRRASTATLLAAVGGALLVVLLGAMALVLRRRVVRPIDELSDVATRIAGGELSRRVADLRGGDEVARMHRSFNAMAASLEVALEDSRSTERMREEFFAVVSHELRTPLTSIVGYVELLADDASGVETLSDGERRRFIEIVDRNSRHLLRLVGDLLLAAQIEEGRMELELHPVDIAGLVREAIEEVAPSVRAGELTLASAIEGPFDVEADAPRLSLAFRNLLSNAIKFTPAGGEVGVSTSLAGAVPVRGHGREVAIEFWDTGVGISDAEQARLFERFYRAPGARHAEAPGVGLGLVITRAIIEAHGGRLEVESAEGGGSTFRCLLPLG